MLHKRGLVAAYWLAGLVLAALAGAFGADAGVEAAPEFEDQAEGGSPATGASKLLFALIGGSLGFLAVIAVFAAIFLVLWVRERRRQEPEEIDSDESFADHIEFGDDDSELFDADPDGGERPSDSDRF